tara:strand:- start:3792 stop:4118 length:327 start_codon:yes stop_codon:yes gene_type:complete
LSLDKKICGPQATLADLYGDLDWSDFAESISDNSRQALLDCAMYLRSCQSEGCDWKGVRRDDGEPYLSCPQCGSVILPDSEGAEVFRRRLGPVWVQAMQWLKEKGLLT